jgi:hypothetical protein
MFSPDSVPDQIRLSTGLKAPALPSRVVRREFLPEGPTTFSASQRNIRIPVFASSAFLDTSRSWLEFDVRFSGGSTGSAYAHSAYSFFDRAEILSNGGQILDSVNDWGLLNNKLADSFMDLDTRGSAGNFMGFSTMNGYGPSFGSTAGDVALHYLDRSGFTDSAPVYMPSPTTQTKSFRIPLACMGLTTLTSVSSDTNGHFLPLALVSRITISLYLRDQIHKMLYANFREALPTSLEIVNVRYNACLVEMDTAVVQQLRSAILQAGGKAYISSNTWLTQRNTTAATTTAQPQISIRARSLKNLLLINRYPSQETVATAGNPTPDPDASVGGLNQFYALIGSKQVPEVQLTKDVQFASSVENAMGQPLQGITRLSMYSTTATPATADVVYASGKVIPNALYGIDLDAIPDLKKESGVDNSSGQLITLYTQYVNGLERIQTIAANVDCVYEVDVVAGDITMSM